MCDWVWHRIVDAAVARLIAAGHAGICRVHNRVAPERRDVALPEIDPRFHRRQIADVRDSSLQSQIAQILILNAENLIIHRTRHTDIHQPPQQLPLLRFIGGNVHPAIPRLLREQRVNEIPPSFCLIHGVNLFRFLCFYYIESVKRG